MKDTTTQNDMGQFFIADRQNEGVAVPLFRPDGVKSNHSITVYGHFSDHYQKVRTTVFTEAKAARDLPEEEKADAVREAQLRLTAALIKDWTFDVPLTEESKMAFLKKAPQIAIMLDRVAGDQSVFMNESSTLSTDTPNGTPISDLSQEDPPAPNENS